MQLLVLPDARFTCSSCTRCCRDWHVELIDDEIESLKKLRWPTSDELAEKQVTFSHGGKTFLAHRADGTCVFLNSSNGLCRIHEQFGGEEKPLGCKLYPFQIVPTFDDELTVTARFDCPTVRQNRGEPHSAALPELQRYVRRMRLGDAFDATTRSGFEPAQIEIICEFIGILLAGFSSDSQRALFIVDLCDWLSSVDPQVVDRSTLAKQFPVIKSGIESKTKQASARPGMLVRVAFRTVLGLYLRRDEDVLNGLASRPSRLIGMMAVVAGGGRLSAVGRLHPRCPLRSVRIFSGGHPANGGETFALFWQMIRDKLASVQFMGSTNPNHDFLRGLRSLALLYPLTNAVARCAAADRGSNFVEAQDVDYAVGSIEHAFGRSPVLAQSMVLSLESLLLRADNFARIVS